MAETQPIANGDTSSSTTSIAQSSVHLPRVAIKFCTQCKWNLRAAYYAQELLQTFSTTLGEVALIPSSGGTFTITLYHAANPPSSVPTSVEPSETSSETRVATRTEELVAVQETVLWDRKMDGGFPETKELKSRVRNVVSPGRDLGHVDRSLKKAKGEGKVDAAPVDGDSNVSRSKQDAKETQEMAVREQKECQDCA